MLWVILCSRRISLLVVVQQNVPQATTTQVAQPVNNTTTLDASSIEMYTDKK